MEFSPGQVIGNYRILRPLGKGGMGTVYEVEHVKLGVKYALKAYNLREGEAEIFRRRFSAEGKILARLVHPNVVRVFDLDFDEGTGTPYYVMDLVAASDGSTRTLASVEPGSVDEDVLLGWFADLCSALDYVHAQGVVHRDVKLGNVLLAPDGHAVLSDFGISRVTDEKLRADVDLARTVASEVTGRMVVGTAGYMSPEVAAGSEATPAADVYALGVVFFKLLTGVWYDPCLSSEKGDGARRVTAAKMLEYFRYGWGKVLPRMLDQDAARRPAKLAELPAVVRPLPRPKLRLSPVQWVFAVAAFLLAMALGAFLGALIWT